MRAFDLARSSGVLSVVEIQRELSREGYYDATAQLAGRQIRKQLSEIIRARRA